MAFEQPILTQPGQLFPAQASRAVSTRPAHPLKTLSSCMHPPWRTAPIWMSRPGLYTRPPRAPTPSNPSASTSPSESGQGHLRTFCRTCSSRGILCADCSPQSRRSAGPSGGFCRRSRVRSARGLARRGRSAGSLGSHAVPVPVPPRTVLSPLGAGQVPLRGLPASVSRRLADVRPPRGRVTGQARSEHPHEGNRRTRRRPNGVGHPRYVPGSGAARRGAAEPICACDRLLRGR